uniref:Uncharacterized protein n=1 Tax=Rhizophora mucronata TaxID=61149 RepID=A0A2P2N7B2_RHIMU
MFDSKFQSFCGLDSNGF